jgi:hypothetical protein
MATIFATNVNPEGFIESDVIVSVVPDAIMSSPISPEDG